MLGPIAMSKVGKMAAFTGLLVYCSEALIYEILRNKLPVFGLPLKLMDKIDKLSMTK